MAAGGGVATDEAGGSLKKSKREAQSATGQDARSTNQKLGNTDIKMPHAHSLCQDGHDF